MNVLVYMAPSGFGSITIEDLDLIIEETNKGNHVFVLNCDETIGLCMGNPGKNPIVCYACKYCQKADMKRYLPNKNVECHWICEYKNVWKGKTIPKFEYNTAKELRALKFDGVDIGFGVMSTYISLTRNMDPKINRESIPYFDELINEQVKTLYVIKHLQQKYNFGLYIFQNGRGAQLKPLLNYCQRNKIDFLCLEDFGARRQHLMLNYFHNQYAHSFDAYAQKYEDFWDSSKDSLEDRIKIGRLFFENRRNAVFAGDKIYVKNQKKGELPKDWNSKLENIVIFNSSEDEFCAVDKEWDDEAVFESQILGIKAIIEHYLCDNTKHFTLRVHPNLKDIPYKYHTDLYKLDYPNLTVIHGKDTVSTYALMDAASKIIVFGSTTGIEAVYWNKPVICLAGAFYRNFDIVYKPKTVDEIWPLIEQKNLPCLRNDNILKFGYFYMSDRHKGLSNIAVDYYKGKIFGRSFSCLSHQKILGSNIIFALLAKLILSIRMLFPAKYSHIYSEEL